MDNLLTIQEISRRSGVAASALRFYEARGLIRSERSGAGHRRFPRPALRRIAFIVFAQRVGLSLDEIGEALAKKVGVAFHILDCFSGKVCPPVFLAMRSNAEEQKART